VAIIVAIVAEIEGARFGRLRFGGLRDREIGFQRNLELMCIINKD
jgi:hypothetical protein